MAKSNIMQLLTQSYKKIKGANHKRNKGIAVLWAAFTLLLLILFMGLTVDGGRLYFAAHQLQNAADAAALAGAQVVKVNQAQSRVQAKYIGGLNYCHSQSVDFGLNPGNDENGDIVLGTYFTSSRLFYPQENPGDFANAVKVVARRIEGYTDGPIPLVFGPIVNVDTADVSQYAIAMSSGGTGAGLIALGCGTAGPMGGDIGLLLDGGSIVDVGGGPVLGEVVVNCGSCAHPKSAVEVANNAIIENAAQMNIVGCYDGPETDYPILDNDPGNYMPDPLGCWPNYECLMPQLSADPDNDLSPAPGEYWIPDPCLAENVLTPGYYSGGINVTSATANIRFEPGTYIVDGEIKDNINAKGGLNLTGGTIDGIDGVMFYILGGSVDIGGGAQVTLNELVPWEDDNINLPYEGMLIYQDPDNITPARIIGTSDMLLVGTLYFPFNHLEVGGGGYAVGSQLIANSILIHTNPNEGVVINYDGRYRAPGSRSFLVE